MQKTFSFFLLFYFLFSFFATKISAQDLDLIQNSPKIKWQKINTPHYSVIYPASISGDAQYVGNLLEKMHQPVQQTLNTQRKKWKILLTTNSSISNAYVSYYPRKSEWFGTPPQDNLLGVNEWYYLLATHEGRHMVQFDKANQRFTKFASYLFGQSAVAGLSFLSIPTWYWEGDAVCSETALSNSGRGRMPSFDLAMRANILNKNYFTYQKAFLQSYKYYLPNHYVLGYFLTAHVRNKYGEDAWNLVIDRTTKYSFFPWTFSNSCKKIIGKRIPELYKETVFELDSLWLQKQSKIVESEYITITKSEDAENLTNYLFPQEFENGKIIALKSGMNDASTLVEITNEGVEKIIRQISPSDKISLANGKVCWSEDHINSRWANEYYSNIAVLDLKSNKIRYITKKSKYLSPAFSSDASKIIVVEFSNTRKCSLVIIDSKTGEVFKRFGNTENFYIHYPVWDNEDRRIFYIRQTKSGKEICAIDIETGVDSVFYKANLENISNLFVSKNCIFYESDFSGIDNIYSISLSSKERFQVISSKYGVYKPSISKDDEVMYFSTYTVGGNALAKIEVDSSKWLKISNVINSDIKYYEKIIAQEGGKDYFHDSEFPKINYPVKKYRPLLKIVNIHSWRVLPLSNELFAGIYSNDILNTTSFGLYADVNWLQKSVVTGVNITYSKFYPVFEITANTGYRTGGIYNQMIADETADKYYHKTLKFSVNLPFQSTKGIYSTYANLSLTPSYSYISGRDSVYESVYDNGTYMPMIYRFSFYRIRRKAVRDVMSKWSVALNVVYQNTPWGGDFKGTMYAANVYAYLPGFAKHDGFQLNISYERQKPEPYIAMHEAYTPRGFFDIYSYYTFREYSWLGMYYEAPVAYPDLALGSVLYIKRIRGGFFYDYAHAKTLRSGRKIDIKTVGVQAKFDFIPFSLRYLEISAGYRLSYNFLQKSFINNFLFLNFMF